MADKNDRAIQARDCTLGRRDVVGQGRERILDGDRIQARLLEQRDHLGPARSVGPCAMHENDIPYPGRAIVCGRGRSWSYSNGKCSCENQRRQPERTSNHACPPELRLVILRMHTGRPRS